MTTTQSVKQFSYYRFGEYYVDSIKGFSSNKNWLDAIDEAGGEGVK